MAEIRTALVEAFGEPPRERGIPAPFARPGQEIVDVLAVGVHHVTRGIASGAHYASSGRLPLVPGVDGIVRRADGSLAFVAAPGTGTMSAQLAVDPRALVPLPDGDPAVYAATLNPLISSWMVLTERVPLAPGADVLVFGATGTSGFLAVQAARHLGAGRVIAAGRNPERLEALRAAGADEIVELGQDSTPAALAAAAADVDVVLDYLWGPVTGTALEAILRARGDETRLLDWVQIGSLAGAEISLPAAALRSNALRLSGSGFGSVPFAAYVRELPRAAALVASGELVVEPVRVTLAEVETAWANEDAPGRRTVVML